MKESTRTKGKRKGKVKRKAKPWQSKTTVRDDGTRESFNFSLGDDSEGWGRETRTRALRGEDKSVKEKMGLGF